MIGGNDKDKCSCLSCEYKVYLSAEDYCRECKNAGCNSSITPKCKKNETGKSFLG